jgi:hypothetical protein
MSGEDKPVRIDADGTRFYADGTRVDPDGKKHYTMKIRTLYFGIPRLFGLTGPEHKWVRWTLNKLGLGDAIVRGKPGPKRKK